MRGLATTSFGQRAVESGVGGKKKERKKDGAAGRGTVTRFVQV
jgi:hypothetical protein